MVTSCWITWTEYWRSTYWPKDGERRRRGCRIVLYPRWFRDQKTYDEQICDPCDGVPWVWQVALKSSHVHRQGVTCNTPGHENCVAFYFERYTDDPDYPFDPPTLENSP